MVLLLLIVLVPLQDCVSSVVLLNIKLQISKKFQQEKPHHVQPFTLSQCNNKEGYLVKYCYCLRALQPQGPSEKDSDLFCSVCTNI